MPSNLNLSVSTMAPDCTKVSHEVMTALIAVLKGLNPPVEMPEVKVRLMGSRSYGLESPTSDIDLAVAFPPCLLSREREIQLLLSHRLVLQELTSSKATEPVHQIANQTLKWTTANGVDASLLVTDDAGLRDAMEANEVVQRFFSTHEPWREPTRRVLTELRKDKLLNTHGRDGEGVGQKLKTVSAALLCIGVLEDVGGDWGAFPIEASVDDKTRLLYERMALFDANACLFKFSRTAKPRE